MNPKLLRAVKIFNIACGLLIVASLVVIGVELYRRTSRPSAPAASPTLGALQAPAAIALDLPAGTRLGEPALSGGRIVVRATTPAGEDALYLLDAADGKILAVVKPGPDRFTERQP